MSPKRTVRVIKKDQQKRREKPTPNPSSASQTAREMVHTVTTWVDELQRKRRTETIEALKFLSETPRPSEA